MSEITTSPGSGSQSESVSVCVYVCVSVCVYVCMCLVSCGFKIRLRCDWVLFFAHKLQQSGATGYLKLLQNSVSFNLIVFNKHTHTRENSSLPSVIFPVN